MQKVTAEQYKKAEAITWASDAYRHERDAAYMVMKAYAYGRSADEEVLDVMARYDARHMQQDRFGK